MKTIGVLQSNDGNQVQLGFDEGLDFDRMLNEGLIDSLVITSEGGFSILGSTHQVLLSALDMQKSQLLRISTWSERVSKNPSVVVIPNTSGKGSLKALALVTGERSLAYEQLRNPDPRKPYRDFYYNLTYETIDALVKNCGAQRIGMTHMSGGGCFHEDIATCNAEALAHYCDQFPGTVDSFSFVGCCIKEEHLAGIQRLNPEGAKTQHRLITTRCFEKFGCTVVEMEW